MSGEMERENERLRARLADTLELLRLWQPDHASPEALRAITWAAIALRGKPVTFVEASHDDLRTRLTAAMKALEPFARLADHFGEPMPDNEPLMVQRAGTTRTGNARLGDLRRARALLHPETKEPGQ